MSDPVEEPATTTGHGEEPSPGRVLSQRYVLEELVARGGMASVWRAHDEALARTVAVKVLHDHLAEDARFRERFRREAVSAAKLAHPNVVSLYDTGADGDQVFLVMEFVEGVTLKDLIAAQAPLDVARVAAIGVQVARGLDYAHGRGLVHRDVKPANILMGPDGAVKVTDFGIAKVDQAGDLTRTGTVMGTAAYVSPEQISGEPVTGLADQYALGVVLYEALTGQQPFKADTPVATAAQRLERDPLPVRSLRPDAPRALEAVLRRALARDPEDRYPTAAGFADALGRFAGDVPGGVRAGVGTGVPAARPRRPTPPPARAAPARRRPPPAPAAAPRAAGVVSSFVRSEGRWLLPVLGLVVLAALLVGVGMATGVLETRNGLPVGIARDVGGEGGGAQAAESGTIGPAAIRVFDPFGSGRENDGSLPHLLDGDPATTWRTSHYNSASFGGLKDGVGFYLDLGDELGVAALALQVTTPGVDLELRTADRPASRLEDWKPVAAVSDAAGGVVELRPDGEVTTRYLLVWITGELPASPHSSGRFTAELSDVAVLARAP